MFCICLFHNRIVHVIFSCFRPLCEGKSLKEKFDAIFASTRYVKALEAIRKFKQEQVKILFYYFHLLFLKQALWHNLMIRNQTNYAVI